MIKNKSNGFFAYLRINERFEIKKQISSYSNQCVFYT